jgi:mRNA interferase RelE/StbE
VNYAIELTPKAERELRKFERAAQLRIRAAIDLLRSNPRPPAAVPMIGQPHGTYRVRTGDYRIIYEVHDNQVLVLVIRIGHRREVYRGF